ncbi:DUF6286 domain-containing protein [Streptomyces boninensis]|uniref:DUF6286 domain-containing protein n=1 Tax=Streptomyces boninensis TaxID=2039455 RepID=UPI003B21F8FC
MSEDEGRTSIVLEKGGGWEQSASSAVHDPGDRRAGPAEFRFWAVRRVPAALVAGGGVLLAGVFLYDIVKVRAEQPGMAWRHRLADELAVRTAGDAWVLLGGTAVLLLGCWLLWLACSPGLRGVLPMRRPAGDVRAGLDRAAAAVVLRDRAMQISGVQAVRVGVGRRRVTARADAHFRDLDDVRTDLDAVLGEGINELGLARRPALTVQVRRPDPKR